MEAIFNRLVASMPTVAGDEFPSIDHQDDVTALAGECLECLVAGPKGNTRLQTMMDFFQQFPLIGSEVIDEALVLHKNRQMLWGAVALQANDQICTQLMLFYNGFSSLISSIRGGNHRKSTTPTLKGGNWRIPPIDNTGESGFLPLIFSMKEFKIGYFPNLISRPAEFSQLACILRGGNPLPTGDQVKKDTWLSEARDAILPKLVLADDAMADALKMKLKWPQDALMALRGVFLFGAHNDIEAKQFALYALKLNARCTIALQLLTIMSGREDPRVPFSDQRTESIDLLSRLSGLPAPVQVGKKPWWRFW